jgi:hypothetical protein
MAAVRGRKWGQPSFLQNSIAVAIFSSARDENRGVRSLIAHGLVATPASESGANMPLRATLTASWDHIQGSLFPLLRAEIGPLTSQHERLIIVLEASNVGAFVGRWPTKPGRPPCDRAALARAFLSKPVLGLPTTTALIERLEVDGALRRLCGWEGRRQVPSEATFSRAFDEFAAADVAGRVHEALIAKTQKPRLIGHICRDSTAIPVREARVRSPTLVSQPKRGRGRPKKSSAPIAPKSERRIVRQAGMSLSAMLAELPKTCGVGAKADAKRHLTTWTGYKLHVDVADGDIPITCLLTSASLHDNQVAIPLAIMTAARVTSLYDVMDCAYDVPEIHAHSRSLGHVPIIAENPRCGIKHTRHSTETRARRTIRFRDAEARRFAERSASERVNAALKDTYGGRFVRVRGHAKVTCHLMFGVVALTAEAVFRLVT